MKFNREKFEDWQGKNQIPAGVKKITNAVLIEFGYGEPFPASDDSVTNEETITLRNRGGYVYAYGKGFSMSYRTSFYADGPDTDPKYIIKFLKGFGFIIENSSGDNGMDSSTNWHDTWWTYDFLYEPSVVDEDLFIIWEDSDYED